MAATRDQASLESSSVHWTPSVTANGPLLIGFCVLCDAVSKLGVRLILQPPRSDISYLLARAQTHEEAQDHWEWLQQHLAPKLGEKQLDLTLIRF